VQKPVLENNHTHAELAVKLLSGFIAKEVWPSNSQELNHLE